jgi:cellobiose phosphorylase
MYRLLVETLLGVNLEGDKLRLEPRMPKAWTTFSIHYRYRQTTYHIAVVRAAGGPGGGDRLSLDGLEIPGSTLPLRDDRIEHAVQLTICGR